jgi:hypothetical protein
MALIKNRLLRFSIFVSLCLASLPATWAHHSQSEYDPGKRLDLAGTVTKLEWKSPHAWIYMDVTNDKGEKVNWSFELPSPNTLMRRDWTRDSLKPGDKIRVTGIAARNFPAIGLARTVKDPNGKAFFTGVTETYEPEPAARGAK